MKKGVINFSIIAHIDHGKSTLAKKLLELSGFRDAHYQMDSMELEKERGITIKSKALRFYYKHTDVNYELNMIDTPGHSDFSYEVSKALYACDFAFLVVDAVKGVQAQTFSNAYKAVGANVSIIPVINKVDLPEARTLEVEKELVTKFGFLQEEIFKVSAKSGLGVKELLEGLIKKYESLPETDYTGTKRALVFDSFYDEHMGVVSLVLVENGSFKPGERVFLNSNNKSFIIKELGYFTPKKFLADSLESKEVGFIVTGLKDLSEVKIGDTIFSDGSTGEPFPGFEVVKPLVYLGVFPRDADKAEDLRKALDILHLSDSSFSYEPNTIGNLGYGFLCGFLGLLHADIILERVKREFNLDIVVTKPSVSYLITNKLDEEYYIHSAHELPDPTFIQKIKEPILKVEIISPSIYTGKIMDLIIEKRGVMESMDYFGITDEKNIIITAKIPLSEVILDFNDKLKSYTSGMGSYDYEFFNFEESDIVRLDIYIADKIFTPLASLVHSQNSDRIGRAVVAKLKEELPREQFDIAIQAKIGGKIIARETIKSFRKDVTAKLYGGDRTRKDKLLDKQKLGKKKMMAVGRVEINKETFLKIIKSYG